MQRAPLKFPIQEAGACPLCKCKTVQFLKDGNSYCSRVACSYDSTNVEEPLPDLHLDEKCGEEHEKC